MVSNGVGDARAGVREAAVLSLILVGQEGADRGGWDGAAALAFCAGGDVQAHEASASISASREDRATAGAAGCGAVMGEHKVSVAVRDQRLDDAVGIG